MKYVNWFIGVLMNSVLLIACHDSKIAQVKQFTAAEQAKPPQFTVNIPDIKELYPYHYAAMQERDPFQRIKVPVINNTAQQPLTAFPIDKLRLVGILSLGRVPRAILLAPNGLVYQAALGDEIGSQQGKIIQINRNNILVTENSIAANHSNGRHTAELSMVNSP